MKKIGTALLILGIVMIIVMSGYKYLKISYENKKVEQYISETTIEKETKDSIPIINSESKEQTKINYKAVLEIPKINLKQGIVDATKNFKSIQYAVSADTNGNYPDEYGNFILYAHSGNSYIAFFNKLNKLGIEDDIFVFFNGIKYHYIIEDKYEIAKTGKAKVLRSKNEKYITLITCNPKEKNNQIVVIGKLINQDNY